MDFKIFSQFVMVAGLAVFGYGGYQKYIADRKAEQIDKQQRANRDYLGAAIAMGNLKNGEEREAYLLMAIGGGAIFFGFAMSAAAKGKK